MSLPNYLRKYFWDIDPNTAKPKAHSDYYVKRILEYGDNKAFLWLKRVFGEKKIKQIFKNIRLSAKSDKFWRLVLKD